MARRPQVILFGDSLDLDGNGVSDECQSTDCDGDGLTSHPKILLLEDVTFANVGRHEVNCRAGVEETKNTVSLVQMPAE